MRYSLILAAATTVAAWPMAELKALGLSNEDIKAAQGKPGQKRQDNSPPVLDPLSGVLSPLGLGGLVPRAEERDEDVNIDAAVLTPKAQRKHYEKRGLIGD